MCGIALSIDADRRTCLEITKRMTDAQAHRGPDADGAHAVQFGKLFVGLGHRRLSILDLSSLGHQPMVDPGTGNVLVFNGEIYNFHSIQRALRANGIEFRSTGDTEVLLAALTRWGVRETLLRLEGMFAFAFLDQAAQTLTLARDPLGIKPLYLAEGPGGRLAVASEVRAVLASGVVSGEICRRGLAGFLAYGAVQQPGTLHVGVRSLPPGHLQVYKAVNDGWKADRPEPYWSFPSSSAIDFESAVETTRQKVTEAVRSHLISDVPVGIFLSAGLDSSIIAGLAAGTSSDLRAFTVGFSDHPDVSEVSLAGATAEAFGLTHVPINLPTCDSESAFAEWLSGTDQPSIDGLNTFVISRAVRREGIKVALSGLGADELFGGYPSFRDVPRVARACRRMSWLPAGVRRRVAQVATLGRSDAVRRKAAEMMTSSGSLSSIYFHRRRVLSDQELAGLGVQPTALGLNSDFQDDAQLTDVVSDDPVQSVSRLETRFYQGNMLLPDSDVLGMAHGLEIRVPFLDRRLVESVHAIPGRVRLPDGQPRKYLLRSAFRHLLRPELTQRPKSGFSLPVAAWMLGPLRDRCRQALAACTDRLGLNAVAVEGVWGEFERQRHGPQWARAMALVAVGDYVSRRAGGS